MDTKEETWDFDNLEEIPIEREKFNLTKIKLTHYYFYPRDIDIGQPISTSIELVNEPDFINGKMVWKKKIVHIYHSLLNPIDEERNIEEIELENNLEIIDKLNNIDLRDLKNNYYIEISEDLAHWELEYNNYFKIVGTYNQLIDEVKEISEILNFEEVIKNELEKINIKLMRQIEE